MKDPRIPYSPADNQVRENTRQQIALEVARQNGLHVDLSAAGNLREYPDQPLDARLVQALAGRVPECDGQLYGWLMASGQGLRSDQAGGLTELYQWHFGRLPAGPEDPSDRDPAPAVPAAGLNAATVKQFTLGHLGIKSTTAPMTHQQLSARFDFHGVPHEQRVRLTAHATHQGHVLPVEEATLADDTDDELGMTFQPRITRGHRTVQAVSDRGEAFREGMAQIAAEFAQKLHAQQAARARVDERLYGRRLRCD
jgi:hypothetical protein